MHGTCPPRVGRTTRQRGVSVCPRSAQRVGIAPSGRPRGLTGMTEIGVAVANGDCRPEARPLGLGTPARPQELETDTSTQPPAPRDTRSPARGGGLVAP